MSKYADQTQKLIEPARDRSRTIGAILVEQGRLRPDDVEEIHEYAVTHGLRFGDAAMTLQHLSQRDIDSAIALQYNYPVLSMDGEHAVSDELVAGYLPQSESVEPIRALRSQLSLRWVADPSRKLLTIASPGRTDGRSWLAANLATVFAQMGQRTLLIDADMRHPRQHQIFRLNNSVGLSSLLTGRAGREIVVRIHPQLRLFVLPAGIIPPNPQELLGRQVFEVVLDLFAEQYDIVILDTPAMAVASDAQIIASRSGSALIVARRNHTSRTALMTSMQDLSNSGAKVIGSVINEH